MKKKTISLSRALSLLSIVMTLLLIMLTGFIAGYVFKRIVSDIYNKSNKSITGSALAGMKTVVFEEVRNGKLVVDMFSASESGYYAAILMDVHHNTSLLEC